jgi:hypothetical protein
VATGLMVNVSQNTQGNDSVNNTLFIIIIIIISFFLFFFFFFEMSPALPQEPVSNTNAANTFAPLS